MGLETAQNVSGDFVTAFINKNMERREGIEPSAIDAMAPQGELLMESPHPVIDLERCLYLAKKGSNCSRKRKHRPSRLAGQAYRRHSYVWVGATLYPRAGEVSSELVTSFKQSCEHLSSREPSNFLVK